VARCPPARRAQPPRQRRARPPGGLGVTCYATCFTPGVVLPGA
jgi:hypothetical protein